ncbi:MAG TPA: hypothetical protein V6C78_19255 [Crinalium sp.]
MPLPLWLAGVLVLLLIACRAEVTNVPSTGTATPVFECVITPPPAELRLDPFYKKYCSALGIPILSDGSVSDRAIQQAAYIVVHMLAPLPDVRQKMLELKLRVGVIGANQVTTDMPEYRNLNNQFPGVDWNTRTRGLGGTPSIPLMTGAEENLLCYPNDVYRGESIFVHEFAHTIKSMGLEFTNPRIVTALQAAYDNARATGLWANTYADDNIEEYWAEGVQSYFNTNLEATPPNGIHNSVNTHEELKAYDPTLYKIIATIFPAADWSIRCP